MHWRWRLADTEPDRPSLRVRVHIGRTEPWPRIDEVGNQSCGKTNHCPSPLTTDEGFIPAHAGKTISRPASTVASWLHPRSRGENDEGGPPARGLLPGGLAATLARRALRLSGAEHIGWTAFLTPTGVSVALALRQAKWRFWLCRAPTSGAVCVAGSVGPGGHGRASRSIIPSRRLA